MGKAKLCSQTPTHSYNLRDREAMKAKKTEARPVPPAPAKKRNRQGNEGNKKVVHFDDNVSSSTANDTKERKILRPKRVIIKDVPIPPPEAQRSASDEMVYASLQERIPLMTMQDLKGMEDILDDLKAQVVWPFANVKNARILNLDVPRGVLLTGVPGTGKTALADAIVNEMEANGRKVSYYQEAGACLCKYFGESEGKLRMLFQTAKDNAPSVIFLDEIDSLGMKRSGDPRNSAMHSILTTLLTELNHLPHGEVLVIAATNCPQLCDAALIRKGRFDLTYSLPLPSPPAREEILRFYFQKKKLEIDEPTMLQIVQGTSGQTGSDLKSLVASIYTSMISRQLPGGVWARMAERELLKRMEDLNLDIEEDIRPKLNRAPEAETDVSEDEE